jgi:hypothetical protein
MTSGGRVPTCSEKKINRSTQYFVRASFAQKYGHVRMPKNVMRVDLYHQMEKTTNQQALIPHFGISGTLLPNTCAAHGLGRNSIMLAYELFFEEFRIYDHMKTQF